MIDKLANDISNDIKDDTELQEVSINVGNVVLMVKILKDVVKLIKSCNNKPSDGWTYTRRQSNRDVRLIDKIVRRHLGWRRYLKDGVKYRNAILEKNKSVSEQDFETMYREVE